jgi:hypothetical protein
MQSDRPTQPEAERITVIPDEPEPDEHKTVFLPSGVYIYGPRKGEPVGEHVD